MNVRQSGFSGSQFESRPASSHQPALSQLMIPLFVFVPEGFDPNDCAAVFLSKSDHSRPVNRVYLPKAEYIDHNESMRKFERLMGREADHAHDATTELEALVSLLPPRQNSGSQV
jgi:hypothetical protein